MIPTHKATIGQKVAMFVSRYFTRVIHQLIKLHLLAGSVTLLLMICCLCTASLRSQANRKKKYGFHQLGSYVDIFNDSPSASDEEPDTKFLRESTRPKLKSK